VYFYSIPTVTFVITFLSLDFSRQTIFSYFVYLLRMVGFLINLYVHLFSKMKFPFK